MKVTKLMGLAVILVALAAAMNALAFKTAEIKNPVTIQLYKTGAASIAFTTATGAGSTGIVVSDLSTAEYMILTINDHPQPNSEYTYQNVFAISKASDSNVLSGLTYELVDASGDPFTGVSVTLLKHSTGSAITYSDITTTAFDVDLVLTLTDAATSGPLTGARLLVTATAADAP